MLSRGSGKCKTDNVESTNVYKSYRIIAEFCMNLTQKLPMPSKGMGSFWVKFHVHWTGNFSPVLCLSLQFLPHSPSNFVILYYGVDHRYAYNGY